jgi:DNA-binding FrmR family transcriptional regulator
MVERAPGGDDMTCYKVMQQLSAARGALNGLMAQLIEEHVEHHVVSRGSSGKRREGAEELLKVLRSFTR